MLEFWLPVGAAAVAEDVLAYGVAAAGCGMLEAGAEDCGALEVDGCARAMVAFTQAVIHPS